MTRARPAFDVVAMRRDDAMLDALARRNPGMASIGATCPELRLLRALATEADADLPPYVSPAPPPVAAPAPPPVLRPVLCSVPDLPPVDDAVPGPAPATTPAAARARAGSAVLRRPAVRRAIAGAVVAAALSAGALVAAHCSPEELSASVVRALSRLDDGSAGARG